MQIQEIKHRTRHPAMQQHRRRPQRRVAPAVSLPEALRTPVAQSVISFFVEPATDEEIRETQRRNAEPGVIAEATAILVLTAFLPVAVYGLRFIANSLFL